MLESLEQGLLIATSILSLLGCTLIFTTWESSTLPNYLSRRIIASMGFAGLMTAFAFSLSIFVNGLNTEYTHQETLCYLQAFLLQYFYLASYLWTSCFAWHLYQIIVIRNEYPEKFLWKYRVVGWGLPGLFLLFLVLRQLTGHVGVGSADRRWCWIAVHTPMLDQSWIQQGAWYQFIFFYFPITGVLLFNSILYRSILKFLVMDPMASRLQYRVATYLSIFFLCSLWGGLNRIVQFTRKDHSPSRILTLFECIGDPLQPLLNAIVYSTNKSSLGAYKARVCCWWSWCTRSSSSSSTASDDGDDSGLSLLSNDGENEADDEDERVYGGVGSMLLDDYQEFPTSDDENISLSGR